MLSPKEYRAFALECAKQAAETPDIRLRAILLERTRLWMNAALHAERSWDEPAKPPAPRPRRA
jgi:hypothetical protein